MLLLLHLPLATPLSPTHAVCACLRRQLFYSFFKTLVGSEVVVELKNDVVLRGVLTSVDQFHNIKLHNVTASTLAASSTAALAERALPHLACVQNCFVRGSVVRYIVLPQDKVDVQLLHDSTRMEQRSDRV